MSVMHVDPISNYENCLSIGGEHVFDVTQDEMPGLEGMLPSDGTLTIPLEQLAKERPTEHGWASSGY